MSIFTAHRMLVSLRRTIHRHHYQLHHYPYYYSWKYFLFNWWGVGQGWSGSHARWSHYRRVYTWFRYSGKPVWGVDRAGELGRGGGLGRTVDVTGVMKFSLSSFFFSSLIFVSLFIFVAALKFFISSFRAVFLMAHGLIRSIVMSAIPKRLLRFISILPQCFRLFLTCWLVWIDEFFLDRIIAS